MKQNQSRDSDDAKEQEGGAPDQGPAARPGSHRVIPASARQEDDATMLIGNREASGVANPRSARLKPGTARVPSLQQTEPQEFHSVPSRKGESVQPETEEVFVILPEDEETSALPVVETTVVEDQNWQGGPTTTEVLKEVPSDLAAAETTATVPIEDVPLVKANPLATGAVNLASVTAPTEAISSADVPGEEIKVIDEIANIASDLDNEEPLGESLSDGSKAPTALVGQFGADNGPAPRGRVRAVAWLTALAAAALVGVLFYPDLKNVYQELTGTGSPTVASNAGAKAHASTTAGTKPIEAPGGEETAESPDRIAFRSRIHLALRVGLRANEEKGVERE